MASKIRAGRAFIELSVDTKGMQRDLRRASRHLKAFGSQVRNMGLAISAAGAAIVGPIALATREFIRFGDQLDKASLRTGVAAEELAALGFAAEQSGSSFQDVERGMRGMATFLGDLQRGSTRNTRILTELGLSLRDIIRLDPADQFLAIGDAIASMGATARADLSRAVFGRAGTMLLPLLEQGPNLERFVNRFRELGASITPQDVAIAAELSDAFNRLRTAARSIAFEIGAALGPSLIKIVDGMRTVTTAIARWVEANPKLIQQIAAIGAALLGIGAAVIAIGGTITLFGVALAGLATAIGLITGPAIGLAGVMGAMGAALRGDLDELKELGKSMQGVAKLVMDAIGVIGNALARGDLKTAMSVISTGLVAAWEAMVARLKIVWIDFKSWFLGSLLDIEKRLIEIFVPSIGGARDSALESNRQRRGALTMSGITERAAAQLRAGKAAISFANALAKARETLGEPEEFFGDLKRVIEDVGEARDAGGPARGQFGGANAALAFGAPMLNVAQQQLNVSRQQLLENRKAAAEAEKLRKQVARGGLVFGP